MMRRVDAAGNGSKRLNDARASPVHHGHTISRHFAESAEETKAKPESRASAGMKNPAYRPAKETPANAGGFSCREGSAGTGGSSRARKRANRGIRRRDVTRACPCVDGLVFASRAHGCCRFGLQSRQGGSATVRANTPPDARAREYGH